MNLRSFLIIPQLEPPIEDHYRDIQYGTSKIALDSGSFSKLIHFKLCTQNVITDEGLMLINSDISLFMLSIPAPKKFNAKSINVQHIAIEQLQGYNVYGLTNEHIFELAMKDIEPENAVLISTKERYISYINWIIKMKGPKYVNIRLSNKKLPTLSLKEQLIILLRRFHPWKEDLDRFILKIEESGFLEAWGAKSSLADISVNPNLENYKHDKEKQLEIYMFIPFIIFLTIGFAFAKFLFICEISLHNEMFLRCFQFNKGMNHPPFQRFRNKLNFIGGKIKMKKFSFILAIYVCLIPIVIFLYFLSKEERKFPAVVGKLND